MTGQWTNCEGSHSDLFEKTNPRWNTRTGTVYSNKVTNYGKCGCCSRIVAINKNGTIRAHTGISSVRKIDPKTTENVVADLLQMREELQ